MKNLLNAELGQEVVAPRKWAELASMSGGGDKRGS